MRTDNGGGSSPSPPASARPLSDGGARRFALRRLIPLLLLVAAGALFLALGGGRYLSFAALADNRARLLAFVDRAGPWAPFAYIFAYAGLIALSVPGASLMTMTGGFLFGPWIGAACAVTGATSGAVVVFLAARAGLAGLAGHVGRWAQRFEAGFRADGLRYLLLLHLVPLIPFWAVNLLAGVMALRLRVFVPGTFFGIMPLALVYASIGSGLGELLEEGHAPGPGMLLRPIIVLPILGLATLVVAPVLYRRWRVGSVNRGPGSAP
jgi:uncharacterized membrane protein YdjX (TVP38/TMEM64 family)